MEQVYFPQAEVIGDIGPSLRLLADRVEGKIPNAGALLPLREGILGRIAARATEDRFTPQRLVHDVRQVMPPDGIVALDNGMYKIWFARNYRTRVANTLLLDNALATMGAGLPSAMAAAMLYPGAPRHGRLRRRRLHDEQPGAGDGRPAEIEPGRSGHRGRRLRHDPLEAGRRGFPDFGMTFGNPDFVKYAEAYGARGTRVEAIARVQANTGKGLRWKVGCIWLLCRSITPRISVFSWTSSASECPWSI